MSCESKCCCISNHFPFIKIRIVAEQMNDLDFEISYWSQPTKVLLCLGEVGVRWMANLLNIVLDTSKMLKE